MKLLELEIDNVRGIRHLRLEPNGENLVVWGPNGSGKSAVVDAIDFLLTGRVSRLVGEGTAGITLDQHGPHVDCKPDEAKVRALVRLPGIDKPVEMVRCMARAKTLDCDKSMVSHLKPIMTLAQRGQHVLTRRELLKYVTAKPSTRAQEIQSLLDITDIEAIRRALGKVRNDYDKALQAAKRRVNDAQEAIKGTAGLTTFQADAALAFVDQARATLGGKPISKLRASELKRDLAPPAVALSGQSVNHVLFERDAESLRMVILEEHQTKVAMSDGQLRTWIATIQANPKLMDALARQQLTKLGLALLNGSGDCPLCDASWRPGELREHLEGRLSDAQTAAHHQQRIRNLASNIITQLQATISSLGRVIQAARQATSPEVDLAQLDAWARNLGDLEETLRSPIEAYPDPRFPAEQVQRMLAPLDLVEILSRIEAALKASYPEATPEQTAWDTLTRLEENLKTLETAKGAYRRAHRSHQRAEILLDSFHQARDRVLGRLYDDVRDRFVELYRELHGADEDDFRAQLEPKGAGVDFAVDFHGRGTHPPHALHSEGHQDSMGLCLYMALAEQLTERVINLIILDDVVMSVDAEHRREICRLLAISFPDRQFLITTHDKTWANQLKAEGVATGRGMVELYNWNIETGPQINQEADMWERIDEALQKQDVPDAAAKLRRGSEEFFGLVCDSLGAPVPYKMSGRWELGDFLPAAMNQYNRLLKKAKSAEQSWGNREQFEALNELDSTASQVFARTNAEQWAVNANVHYNTWTNFSKKDFQPVVETFQDLYGLFTCSQCGGMLRVATRGIKPIAVRCSCGKVNWNLAEKGKS